MVLGLGIQIPTLGKAVLNPVLGLSLLSCATVVVNATPELQGPRLLAIGEHQFRAHYMGSSSLVEAGIQRFSAEDQLKQRRAVLERLKEVHVPGNDLEYAGLLDAQGAAWLAATKDPREALKWHQQALESYPLLRTNIYHLVVCHMMVGDPVQAFQFAPTLVAMGHPDPEKSLRMGVHVAVAAGKRLEALEWAQRLRRRDPTRDFYRTLEQQLAGNTPLPTILSCFNLVPEKETRILCGNRGLDSVQNPGSETTNTRPERLKQVLTFGTEMGVDIPGVRLFQVFALPLKFGS